MSIPIDQLEAIVDSDRISEKNKEILRILLEAMNNWPVEFKNTDDFRSELKKHIIGPLDKRGVEQALKTTSVVKEAWKAESLAVLLCLFAYYDEGWTLTRVLSALENEMN